MVFCSCGTLIGDAHYAFGEGMAYLRICIGLHRSCAVWEKPFTSNICPDRIHVKYLLNTVTSYTCPDPRCFVSKTFYIHIKYICQIAIIQL